MSANVAEPAFVAGSADRQRRLIGQIVSEAANNSDDTLTRAVDAGLTTEHFADNFARQAYRAIIDGGTADAVALVVAGIGPLDLDAARDLATTGLHVAADIDAILTEHRRRTELRHATALVEALNHGDGDAAARAREELAALADPTTMHRAKRLAEILAARRFDANNPPPPAPPIFRIAGASVVTSGNLLAIVAQSKAGKSHFVGAMLAATTGRDGDTLGVTSENPNGHAVIHVDSEQSPTDHHALVETAFRRVECDPPSWLRSYRLVDVSTVDRFAALETELEQARRDHGGIHSVFIDGVADLADDPNDPKESFATIGRLHALAATYSTAIACVLHLNPGTEINKSRGHLGSQLERKAETNLVMDKDGEGVTTVYSTRARHATITKADGPRFTWSNEAHMHVSTVSRRDKRDDEKREKAMTLAEATFEEIGQRRARWSEVLDAIGRVRRVARSTAEDRFSELKQAGVIRKCDGLPLWELNPTP